MTTSGNEAKFQHENQTAKKPPRVTKENPKNLDPTNRSRGAAHVEFEGAQCANFTAGQLPHRPLQRVMLAAANPPPNDAPGEPSKGLSLVQATGLSSEEDAAWAGKHTKHSSASQQGNCLG